MGVGIKILVKYRLEVEASHEFSVCCIFIYTNRIWVKTAGDGLDVLSNYVSEQNSFV